MTVPKDTKSLYQSTAGWDKFQNIVEAEGTGVDAVMHTANKDSEIIIYTLSGQQASRTTRRYMDAAWQQLPNGVYIVKGKKRMK